MSSFRPTVETKISPDKVHESLAKHMLVDGFPIIFDSDKSKGTILHDSKSGKDYLDFFTFFASGSIGHNHPGLLEEGFYKRLAHVALNKVSNSDIYTTEMAEFVETFARVALPDELPYLFFISGGALAVENALKAAFDWKVRKNFEKGQKQEKGQKVIHFREAFHGRTGYTMSLTNTDPTKTDYFPKFAWPRIENPKVTFPIEDNLDEIVEAEKRALDAIRKAVADDGEDIAAIIIEPIQGEGGDNHFRAEFFRELRAIADENEIILIFDEIQTGLGITGKMWCHEHYGVRPDILAFGKKTQVCGIMSSGRINEVDSVFKVSSRINSTWGGNLVDMWRAKRILEIIETEKLVDNAAAMGKLFLGELQKLGDSYPGLITNARGKGLFCAFDLTDTTRRDTFLTLLINKGLLALKCGPRTIRFRPPLNVSKNEIERAVSILGDALDETKDSPGDGDTSGAVHTK